MVLRHENKHPPPVCKKGDGVIVKLTKNDKKNEGKGKAFYNGYKIEYKVEGNGKFDWFHVCTITSETQTGEIK